MPTNERNPSGCISSGVFLGINIVSPFNHKCLYLLVKGILITSIVEGIVGSVHFSTSDITSLGFVAVTCIYLIAVLRSPYFSHRDMRVMRHLGLLLIAICLLGIVAMSLRRFGRISNPTPLIIGVIYSILYLLYVFGDFMLPFKISKDEPVPAPTQASPSMIHSIPIIPPVTPIYAQHSPSLPVYSSYQPPPPPSHPSYPVKN